MIWVHDRIHHLQQLHYQMFWTDMQAKAWDDYDQTIRTLYCVIANNLQCLGIQLYYFLAWWAGRL